MLETSAVEPPLPELTGSGTLTLTQVTIPKIKCIFITLNISMLNRYSWQFLETLTIS